MSVDQIINSLSLLNISDLEKVISGALHAIQKKNVGRKCVKCLINDREILLEKCQHLCLCQACLMEHYMEDGKLSKNFCPICGKLFESIVPVLYT